MILALATALYISALVNVNSALSNVNPALGNVIPALGNVILPAQDIVIVMLDLNRAGSLDCLLLCLVCVLMLCTWPSAVNKTAPSDHTF